MVAAAAAAPTRQQKARRAHHPAQVWSSCWGVGRLHSWAPPTICVGRPAVEAASPHDPQFVRLPTVAPGPASTRLQAHAVGAMRD